MLFTQTAYIGIDPTAGPNAIAYAAIDGNLRLMALGHGELDEVLAFMGGQHKAIVAMNGPAHPNQGLMKLESVREKLTPAPNPGRWENMRLCEYILHKRNLPVYHTADNEEDVKPWMQLGFKLNQRLQALGYGVDDRKIIEVSAATSYQTLLGKPLFRQRSLEGRIQRQLILYDLDINLPDPMNFFEEITRFRILQGIFPEEHLFSSLELQVLIIAYMAWVSSKKPNEVERVGDETEGQIVLPAAPAYTFNLKA